MDECGSSTPVLGLDDGIEIRVADIKRYARTPGSTRGRVETRRGVRPVGCQRDLFSKRRPKADGPRRAADKTQAVAY